MKSRLQIVLESFCVHSAFVHRGVHPFLVMLPLWSPSFSPRCGSRSPWLSPSSIWYSGLTALFLFLLARVAPAYLPTALSGTETTLSFSAGPVCSSFSAEACAILHALCWCRQHQQVYHFSSTIWLSFCSQHHILSSIFSFTSISLTDLAGTVFSLLLLYQATNWSPDTRFSLETTRLMRWPDGERYLRFLQSLVVSLLSFVSILFLSWTGGVLSHRSSSTHRLPQFPPRNLCSLVMLAVFSLVYAATDTAYC